MNSPIPVAVKLSHLWFSCLLQTRPGCSLFLQVFHPCCYQSLTIFLIFSPTFSLLTKGEIWDSFSCWVEIFPVIIFRIPFDPGVPGWAPQQMCGYLTFFLSAVIPGPSSGDPGVAGFVLFHGASAPSSHPELFHLLSFILFPIKLFPRFSSLCGGSRHWGWFSCKMNPSASHRPNRISSALPPPCQVPSTVPSCSFPRQTRTFIVFQTPPVLFHPVAPAGSFQGSSSSAPLAAQPNDPGRF